MKTFKLTTKCNLLVVVHDSGVRPESHYSVVVYCTERRWLLTYLLTVSLLGLMMSLPCVREL